MVPRGRALARAAAPSRCKHASSAQHRSGRRAASGPSRSVTASTVCARADLARARDVRDLVRDPEAVLPFLQPRDDLHAIAIVQRAGVATACIDDEHLVAGREELFAVETERHEHRRACVLEILVVVPVPHDAEGIDSRGTVRSSSTSSRASGGQRNDTTAKPGACRDARHASVGCRSHRSTASRCAAHRAPAAAKARSASRALARASLRSPCAHSTRASSKAASACSIGRGCLARAPIHALSNSARASSSSPRCRRNAPKRSRVSTSSGLRRRARARGSVDRDAKLRLGFVEAPRPANASARRRRVIATSGCSTPNRSSSPASARRSSLSASAWRPSATSSRRDGSACSGCRRDRPRAPWSTCQSRRGTRARLPRDDSSPRVRPRRCCGHARSRDDRGRGSPAPRAAWCGTRPRPRRICRARATRSRGWSAMASISGCRCPRLADHVSTTSRSSFSASAYRPWPLSTLPRLFCDFATSAMIGAERLRVDPQRLAIVLDGFFGLRLDVERGGEVVVRRCDLGVLRPEIHFADPQHCTVLGFGLVVPAEVVQNDRPVVAEADATEMSSGPNSARSQLDGGTELGLGFAVLALHVEYGAALALQRRRRAPGHRCDPP